MQHRAEIDGLRAIAVVSVILFHAGFSLFRGGFVGVDVFFVISGFLITTIIISELEDGNFSIVKFYERRARRILPALFLVLLVCLPLSWLWLLPQDMVGFSQSLIAVSTFVSNVLFWRTSGYFETGVELKPLLHTWSLAVEEQYYVIFPVFLMLAWRLGKRWILVLLAVAALGSLAAAQWASAVKPAAAFYLLPTRGWELLVGTFVAFRLSRSGGPLANRSANEAGAWIGLILLAIAILAFGKATPFPSVYALVPTLGTALIILCATSETSVGKLLGSRAFVGLGLISYSAYLWHQPLFAFARQRSLDQPGPLLFGALAVASIFLAYISWKYVETPFRNRHSFSRRRIFEFGAAGSAAFIAFGLAGCYTNGFEGRLAGAQAQFLSHFDNSTPGWKYFLDVGIPGEFRFQCDFYDIAKFRSGNSTSVPVARIADECFVRQPTQPKAVFIWGDSHAQQLYSGLRRELPADWQILQVASSGCAAALDGRPRQNNYCDYSNWFAFQAIAQTHPDVVIIGQDLQHDVATMARISARLKAIDVRKVIFTGPTPHWRIDLPKLVAYRLWPQTPRRTRAGLDADVLALDTKLKKDFPSSASVRFVSIIDDLCSAEGCDVYLGDGVRAGITSWDYGHLTPTASDQLAKDELVRAVVDDN